MSDFEVCEYDTDCGFTVSRDMDPVNGNLLLAPLLDPSSENGLECRGDGMWAPDEQCAVFCETIFDGLFSPDFNNATNTTLPILAGLTVTNPSAVFSAMVYWAWYVTTSTIIADPGVRGTIVTLSSDFPNPLIDTSYHVWKNTYPDLPGFMSIPGASFGFPDCPTLLGPGASVTKTWAYRFEGAGGVGTWNAVLGPLRASAIVVTVP